MRHSKSNKTYHVVMYTDGAGTVSGSRAYFGGWAAILLFEGHEKIVTGSGYPETNQTSELKALLLGLHTLKYPCEIEFYSDSQYLVDGTNDWIKGWTKRHWRTSENDPVANQELWKEIERQKSIHKLHGNWIRGHVAKKHRNTHHEYNARCDELAVAEAWKAFHNSRHSLEMSGEEA